MPRTKPPPKTKRPPPRKPQRANGGVQFETRAFSLRADTINEDDQSVEAAIATEKPVAVFDDKRWEIVDEILLMSGAELPTSRQIPLLDTHNRWTLNGQLGSCRGIHVEKDALVGRNTFARTAGAMDAWLLVRDKHVTDNSIGYRVMASTVIEAGESAEVEGRTYTAKDKPLKVCTRWAPRENSVCPIGADETAKNRAEEGAAPRPPAHPAPAHQRKDKTMNEFEKWLQARGLDNDALTEESRTALRADFDAEKARESGIQVLPAIERTDLGLREMVTAAVAEAVPAALTLRETQAADQRRSRITELAEIAGVDDETRNAVLADTEISVAGAREMFITHMRDARPAVGQTPGIHVHPSASDASARTVEAALLIRGGHGDAAAGDGHPEYTEEIIDNGNRLRGMSMEDLCRHCLRLQGIEVPIGRDDAIRAAISTGSFGEITSNVAGVSALLGGVSVAQTWRAWCSVGEVRNFQANKMVRLDMAGNLATVGDDGKLAHINLEDTGESITAETKGNILVITRKTIRDDRIGILTKAPMELGAGAIQTISQTVYTLLLANGNMADGAAIFVDATRGNLKTSCTLGPAGIQTAAAALAAQNNAKGQPRDLIPAVLLCPPGQYSDAHSSVSQPLVLASGPSTSVGTYVPAVHAYGDGSIIAVMESRLANAAYTGYSATDWYLMASPKQCDNVRVDFLDGVQTPTVREVSPGPGVLGVAIEVYIDYGAAAADGQGMIKCQE